MTAIASNILIDVARKAALFAYSPYSKFRVGAAAIFVESADIYSGCNVENASYGLTICAERVAICKAISKNNRQLVKIAIAVVDEYGMPQKSFMPCGACLQFMQEFSGCRATPEHSPDVIIDGVGRYVLKDLLPRPF
jgi:cytidine deaminase